MTDFLRWQWMWRSRPRLLLIAVGAVVFGGLLILFALTRTRPLRKGEMLLIYGGITFVVMGLYQLLQGLFSPAGAFGDHDDAAEEELHRKRVRRLRRRAAKEAGKPLPQESDLTPDGDQRET